MRACGLMYKALDRLVLMYGSDSWVMTEAILQVLEDVHHQVYRPITVITATRGVGREWEYPPVVAALEASGLNPIMDYIRRRQSTIAENFAFRPVYKICVKAGRKPGTSQRVKWWYQDVVNEPD